MSITIHTGNDMKYRILSLHLLALILSTSGCITDPRAVPEEERTDIAVGPIDMRAVTIDNETIRLQWIQHQSITLPVSYRVTWEPLNTGRPKTGRDTGTQYFNWSDGTVVESYLNGNSRAYQADIGPLEPGQFYVFYVHVKRVGSPEEDIVPSLQAAPAHWCHTDAARPGEPIRLYEEGSSMGSGLVLDPALGGPTRVTPETAPHDGVQLVFIADDRHGIGNIIPAIKSAEYSIPGLADRTTLVGSQYALGYEVTVIPLNEWYMKSGQYNAVEHSLDINSYLYLAPGPGREEVRYMGTFLAFGSGPDFIGSRRYVRISAVSDTMGEIIRGTAPNRYVELLVVIGYPGIPWA